MANKNLKSSGNISGKFYVDETCLACATCQVIAPNNFKINEKELYSFVYKQPENEEEYKLCQDAIEACCVNAIGEDE